MMDWADAVFGSAESELEGSIDEDELEDIRMEYDDYVFSHWTGGDSFDDEDCSCPDCNCEPCECHTQDMMESRITKRFNDFK